MKRWTGQVGGAEFDEQNVAKSLTALC